MDSTVVKAATKPSIAASTSPTVTEDQRSQGRAASASDQQIGTGISHHIDVFQSVQFQECNSLDDDVKSYAALVHQQKAPDRWVHQPKCKQYQHRHACLVAVRKLT